MNAKNCTCMADDNGVIEEPSGSCPIHGWMAEGVNDEYVSLPVADVEALMVGYAHASARMMRNPTIDAADEASDRIQDRLPK